MEITNVSAGNRIPAWCIYDTANSINHKLRIETLTRAGGTATAKAQGHGLATGNSVTIAGAVQTDYNVTAIITVTDADHFTYTVSNSPATPATFTVTAGITVTYMESSLIVPMPSVVQVDTVPNGTQAKIQSKVHPNAMWVDLATVNPTDGPTHVMLHETPLNQVRVIRSAGSGALKAWAQSGATRIQGV